jgi:DNA polymerase-4
MILGKYGHWIFETAQGCGSDVVGEEWGAKSISREETFSKDIADLKELERILFELVEDVCQRVRSRQWKARTITLKLRYSDFKTVTHAESVEPTNDDTFVTQVAYRLLHSAYKRKLPIRLLGIRLSNFDEEQQLELSLFPSEQKKQNILSVIDKLRKKHGDGIIHIGGI